MLCCNYFFLLSKFFFDWPKISFMLFITGIPAWNALPRVLWKTTGCRTDTSYLNACILLLSRIESALHYWRKCIKVYRRKWLPPTYPFSPEGRHRRQLWNKRCMHSDEKWDGIITGSSSSIEQISYALYFYGDFWVIVGPF